MRLQFVMPLPFHPPLGGANKANRALAERLARKHSVEVIAPAVGVPATLTLDELRAEMRGYGKEIAAAPPTLEYRREGLHITLVTNPAMMRRVVSERVQAGRPDCVVVSSEESTQTLLEVTVARAPERVVYLLHTPNFLPFGPLSFFPGEKRSRLFERATIVAVSRFSADYVRRWGGFDSELVYLPAYGNGPFPDFGTSNTGYVTLINPCRYKGIDIFLSLADTLPGVAFAAVPTWGTTTADRAALERRPNVRLLQPSIDIDEIFRQTRVLLVPSLWLENFPMVIVEAMLRGIPVLASDVGGIPEAKLETWGVIPVDPIEGFQESLDENGLPVAAVREQSIAPWVTALERLDGDHAFYGEQSRAARQAAHRFVGGIRRDAFEGVLESVVHSRPEEMPWKKTTMSPTRS